eukprot:998773-Prymnesium_polylepis.1
MPLPPRKGQGRAELQYPSIAMSNTIPTGPYRPSYAAHTDYTSDRGITKTTTSPKGRNPFVTFRF